MYHTTVLLALVLAAVPLPAKADSWGPFFNFRQVEPTGRFYLVVKKEDTTADTTLGDPGRGTPVNVEFVERKMNSPRVAEVWDSFETGRVIPNPEVKVREGDIVHGRVRLDRSPAYYLISSTGLGFVGIDVRGYNFGRLRSGDAVVIVAKDGTIRHRKNLIDLFSEEELQRFCHTGGGIAWAGGGWIDERRHEVIVVSGMEGPLFRPIPPLFRIVSIETVKVRPGSTQEVVTALADNNSRALDLALDLTIQLKLKDASAHLPAIFANEQFPVASRLRAAVALGNFGDQRGTQFMVKVALEKGDAQYYAVKHLPAVLGDKAAPVLCDAVRRFGNDCYVPALQAMFSVSSDAAVPELIRLLDENGSFASQTFAAECLGKKGPAAKAAVPNLMKMLASEPRTDRLLSDHQYAALALGRIGSDAREALPLLIRRAEQHAKEEWERVKDKQPELRPDNFGGMKFSDDYFVDAICKIRRK